MSRTAYALALAFASIALIADDAPAQSPAAGLIDAQLQHYFYVDFPQRLASINNQIAFAEAELTLLGRRVDQYRPMRSFHQYGATYLADQSAQLAVLATRQNLDCLRAQKTALWRERQAVAEQAFAATPQ